MKSQRPSRTTTGNLTHLISKATVEALTLGALLLTQDGGRCSDLKVAMLSTIKERYWKSKEAMTMRTETLVSTIETTRSTSNGILSTLINGRVNQPRVNSTRDSVFTLKEISTLFQHSQVENTST
jgi:hypothetical protein